MSACPCSVRPAPQKLEPLLDKLEAMNQEMDLGDTAALRSAELVSFRKPLMETAVLSTLNQLRDVYSTVRIDAFRDIVPFMTFL